jgi:hypothetical protein
LIDHVTAARQADADALRQLHIIIALIDHGGAEGLSVRVSEGAAMLAGTAGMEDSSSPAAPSIAASAPAEACVPALSAELSPVEVHNVVSQPAAALRRAALTMPRLSLTDAWAGVGWSAHVRGRSPEGGPERSIEQPFPAPRGDLRPITGVSRLGGAISSSARLRLTS